MMRKMLNLVLVLVLALVFAAPALAAPDLGQEGQPVADQAAQAVQAQKIKIAFVPLYRGKLADHDRAQKFFPGFYREQSDEKYEFLDYSLVCAAFRENPAPTYIAKKIGADVVVFHYSEDGKFTNHGKKLILSRDTMKIYENGQKGYIFDDKMIISLEKYEFRKNYPQNGYGKIFKNVKEILNQKLFLTTPNS
ncbi:hypothetical protein [Sporolituus thermophilus]|uniref:Uncharacterized protein n=1 Tax=Sporolituus thermophilus DSM 23256 TaxID=1123285 RepID=A0A1G7MI85_9FIRM|nr:hypothetical protein [Sporolituus thermophilus]SDF61423.1 hypothetical protein SAMN05660235_02177 [Sporolituus thermophilus DSM 23256]